MRLTPALHRALDVLELGPARYSNLTARGCTSSDGREQGRTVYWQSADKLAQLGLVTITTPAAGGFVILTAAGLELLEHRGAR